MDYSVNVSAFNQAIAVLQTIRAKYGKEHITLTGHRIFSVAATALKIVWNNAVSGLHNARYPELQTYNSRIEILCD